MEAVSKYAESIMPDMPGFEIIREALAKLQEQRDALDKQIAALRSMLGEEDFVAEPKRGKGKLSASAKAAISAGQKRRWDEKKRVAQQELQRSQKRAAGVLDPDPLEEIARDNAAENDSQ